MPVKLVKTDERLTFEYEGGNYYYRRLPIKMKNKLTSENTNARGTINFYGIILGATPYCLLGWDDGAVIDTNDKPCQFSLDAAFEMPEDFFTVFSGHLGVANPDSDETNGSLKNSKGT